MKIICPHCSKGYSVSEDRIRQFGHHVIFPCPSCKGRIEVKLDKHPTPAPSAVVPPRPSDGDDLRKVIIASVNDLPPMPQVAQHARRVIADKNCTFSDIARVIEADQAIATKVLRLANSAYYGVMGTVTSIQHAAMILGIKTLSQLLEIACSASVLSARLPGYGQESGELWRHSLAVAACARAISKRHNPTIIDDAFSAGLIHDCGKLILDRHLAVRSAMFQKYLSEGKRVFEAERAVFGFDHAQIAGSVCEKWDIPRRLVNAVQFHHAPSLLQVNELACIVHTANIVMHVPDMSAVSDISSLELDPVAIRYLNLDIKHIAFAWNESQEYVSKTLGFL